MRKNILRVESFFRSRFGLQKKVVILYIFMAILPIILITTLAYFIYYRSILKEAYAFVEQNTKQHEIVITERLQNYKSIMYELVCDNEVINLTKQLNNENEKEKIVTKWNLDQRMRSYIYTYDGIRSVAFIMSDNDYVGYSKWYSSIEEVIWSVDQERESYYKQVSEYGDMLFLTGVNLANRQERKDYVIVVGMPVRDLVSKEQTGVMLLALDDNVLNFDGKAQKFDEGEEDKTGVTAIIVDENNRILASEFKDWTTKKYEDFVEMTFLQNSNLDTWEEKIGDTGWRIICIIDKDVYLKNIYIFTRVVFIFAAGITLVFFFFVFLISRKYIGTIAEIAKGIGEYGTNQRDEIQVNVDEKDELYVIALQFNQMTRRVNALVDTLKKKNDEIQKAVTRQKHAEIKALEAQINPHFLFNTLDSISWRAIEHDEEEISDMIGTLGSLLRYSISNIDTVVVLEAEISWLKKYVFLQRDRFNNSFDCIYDIQEEAMSFPIYRMLMQPIVENTILHAFEEVREGGVIYVQAYIQEDGYLYLKIADNGAGMSEDKLSDIRGEIKESGYLNGDSIGISNVINRLKIYYKGDAELLVESKYGVGTEFEMIIPNIMKESKGRGEVHEKNHSSGRRIQNSSGIGESDY